MSNGVTTFEALVAESEAHAAHDAEDRESLERMADSIREFLNQLQVPLTTSVAMGVALGMQLGMLSLEDVHDTPPPAVIHLLRGACHLYAQVRRENN